MLATSLTADLLICWLTNLASGLPTCLPACKYAYLLTSQTANLLLNLPANLQTFHFHFEVVSPTFHRKEGCCTTKMGYNFAKSFLLPTFVPIRNIWLLLTQFFGDQHFYGSTFFGTKISLIEISLNPNIFGLKFFLTEFFLTKIIFGQKWKKTWLF